MNQNKLKKKLYLGSTDKGRLQNILKYVADVTTDKC